MHGNRAPLFVTTGALCHDLAHHKTAQPIHRQGQKCASDSTPHTPVRRKRHMHVSTHMSAAGWGAMGITQRANVLPNSNPLESIITPLQHLNFEEELHSGSKIIILSGIRNGVQLGYKRPRRRIRLLHSSTHKIIVNDELAKEITAQRIVGPFDHPPLPNLQCSGIGVVATKENRRLEDDHAPLSPS